MSDVIATGTAGRRLSDGAQFNTKAELMTAVDAWVANEDSARAVRRGPHNSSQTLEPWDAHTPAAHMRACVPLRRRSVPSAIGAPESLPT